MIMSQTHGLKVIARVHPSQKFLCNVITTPNISYFIKHFFLRLIAFMINLKHILTLIRIQGCYGNQRRGFLFMIMSKVKEQYQVFAKRVVLKALSVHDPSSKWSDGLFKYFACCIIFFSKIMIYLSAYHIAILELTDIDAYSSDDWKLGRPILSCV